TGSWTAARVGGRPRPLGRPLAHFVGTAVVAAGLGALVAHVTWSYVGGGSDPPPIAVILLSLAGALGAMMLQRYVIIVSTAFGGAWTMIVGGLAATGERTARATSADVWILYPTTPAPGKTWVPIAWVGLGLVGTVVQLGVTGRRK